MTEENEKKDGVLNSDNSVESNRVLDILKPTLHDNDFLQSFVRIELDDGDNNKQSKEGLLSSKRASSRSGKQRGRRPSYPERRQSVRKTQESLQLEMKEQRSRKKRRRMSEIVLRQEEVYTDKDRAAAVNLGSRDIKQSLKIKRRQDRSRALKIPEEANPNAILTLGYREMRAGNHDVALDFIDKALELNPKDKNALIARSKCYLLLGKPDKALEDAERVLEGKLKDIDKSRAIFCKAEALFHLGNFEMSLVYYHQGKRIRPEFDQFRLGVQKAKEAIQNILDKQIISILPEHLNRFEIEDKVVPCESKTTVSRISTMSEKTIHSVDFEKTEDNLYQKENVNKKSKKNATEKKKISGSNICGRLNVDKRYLKNLLKIPDIRFPYQDTVRNIATQTKEGIEFLETRQEFWRQQRASY